MACRVSGGRSRSDRRQARAGGRRRPDAHARRDAVRRRSGRRQPLSRAGKLVDPRPYAVGSIQKTFEKFPHLWQVLPAMGYSDTQRHELEETIKRVPCDLVLVATPIDLARTIKLDKPSVRVSYEVEEIGAPAIPDLIERLHRRAQASSGGSWEVTMPAKDFLSIRDFTPQQIRHFLHVATQMKAYPQRLPHGVEGQDAGDDLREAVVAHAGDASTSASSSSADIRSISRLPRSAWASASRCTTWPRTWNAWCRAS